MRDAASVCKAWLARVTRVWWLSLLLMALGAGAAEAAPFAYVTNKNSNAVSVIDTATNTVVATVALGDNCPAGVAITPGGAFAYVANPNLYASCNTPSVGTVSVIDTDPLSPTYNTVVATVPNVAPTWVAITPDSAFAYVTNDGAGTVSVIATATNTVVATVQTGSAPQVVAITPDGAFAYVTDASSTVWVIATATNTVVATVTGLGNPLGVAITPDGARAYVANFGGFGSVSVIDTATNTVIATVPVGDQIRQPWGVAITPDGTFAYVTTRQDIGNVVVIDTDPLSPTYNTVVATVPVESRPEGVAITPDGTFAYVANNFSNSVSVIATATNTVVATITVGTEPIGVAITPF